MNKVDGTKEYIEWYTAKYGVSPTERKCRLCNEIVVTHKYCKPCAYKLKLDKQREKWLNDPGYRDRHRVAARKSYHVCKGRKNVKHDAAGTNGPNS